MKVAVGLSGGIDSGTTAHYLKSQGASVIGLTLWLFDHQTEELESASKIASLLGIKHHVLDYRQTFKTEIVDLFMESYATGQTPNPCVHCNQAIKYGKLMTDAFTLGAERFATGHYAQCISHPKTGELILKQAKNQKKDQSYILFHLTQNQLDKILFPLGHVRNKAEVRRSFESICKDFSKKRDSQGICFINRKSHVHFLKTYNNPAAKPGKFVDQSGKYLAHHLGTANYTIGQKRKLGPSLSGKYVVTGINPIKHQVILGKEEDLYVESLTVNAFHIIQPSLLGRLKREPLNVRVKTSQWSHFYPATLQLKQGTGLIHFEVPTRAPAKGQAIVVYLGDAVIGGGLL
jgi:tRNA-specific 2-thiouridylase